MKIIISVECESPAEAKEVITKIGASAWIAVEVAGTPAGLPAEVPAAAPKPAAPKPKKKELEQLPPPPTAPPVAETAPAAPPPPPPTAPPVAEAAPAAPPPKPKAAKTKTNGDRRDELFCSGRVGASAIKLPDEVINTSSMRELLSYLADNGVTTVDQMVEECLALKTTVPILGKIPDVDSRVRRASEVLGLFALADGAVDADQSPDA